MTEARARRMAEVTCRERVQSRMGARSEGRLRNRKSRSCWRPLRKDQRQQVQSLREEGPGTSAFVKKPDREEKEVMGQGLRGLSSPPLQGGFFNFIEE